MECIMLQQNFFEHLTAAVFEGISKYEYVTTRGNSVIVGPEAFLGPSLRKKNTKLLIRN